MMEYIKNAALFLIIGLVLQLISVWLQSDFLNVFLDDNLITLLLALLAINITTLSVIMTKLKEMTEEKPLDFSVTIKAMKDSVVEQVVLLALAAVISILKASNLINSVWNNAEFVFDVVLASIFVASVYILYDTANGVFVILKHENDDGVTPK